MWQEIARDTDLRHAEAMAATEGADPDSVAMWVDVFVGKFNVRIPAHRERPFRLKVNADSDRC
jgi:hypothetical protein